MGKKQASAGKRAPRKPAATAEKRKATAEPATDEPVLVKRQATPPPSPPPQIDQPMYTEKHVDAKEKIVRWTKKLLPRSTGFIAARFNTGNGPRALEVVMTEKVQFDALSSDLRRREVIESAGDWLLRIIQLCNWGTKDKPLITGTVNAKIYLAAYMIAAMPKNVFDEIGELEQAVIDASEPIIAAFHDFANGICQGLHWKKVAVSKELPTLLCRYLRSFKDWKISDEKKLAGRLRRALDGINETIEKTKENKDISEAEMNKEIEALDEQRMKLERKLTQIGGCVSGEPKENGAAKKQGGATAAKVVKTHNVGDLGAQSGNGGGGGMSNEQLAHELLIDSGFRLDDKAGISDEKLVHTKIRETFERAFWNSLIEDLTCVPPSFAPVLNVLNEIKAGLEQFTKDTPEHHIINEILDVDHIKAQLKEGALDIFGCQKISKLVIGVIVCVNDRMKSVERKEETLALWKEREAAFTEANAQGPTECAKAICDGLELILDRIHKIRVDTANNKLRAIAPVIRQHGVEYEKSHFAKKIANGTITLERTEAWLKYTVETLLAQIPPFVNLKDIDQRNIAEKFEAVVRMGVVDLVAEYPNWNGVTRIGVQVDELPETLMLDLLRVKALNVHIMTDAVSAVILIQVEQECKNRVRVESCCKKILKNVTDILLSDPPRPSKPEPTIEKVMAEIVPYVSDADATIIRTLITKHVQRNHLVFKHVLKQFKVAWYHVLAKKEYKMKLPEAAMYMEQQTKKHAAMMHAMEYVNLKVHTKRYNEMLCKIAPGVVGESAGV